MSLDFTHTQLSFRRSILDYSKVQALYSSLIRNRKFQITKALLTRKYLNAGCGPNIKPAFINLDYKWKPGVDLCWDLRKPLPFKDGSLTGVFTEHCLEHLHFTDCIEILKKFHRVLKQDGVLRIVVPDAELYLRLYNETRNGKSVTFPYQSASVSPMMEVNQVFRGHGHLFAYDFETLAKVLSEAGFSNITRTDFMKGRCEALLIDSAERAVGSLYVEAHA